MVLRAGPLSLRDGLHAANLSLARAPPRWHPVPTLPADGSVRKNVCCVSHPVCGILLRQPGRTKTGWALKDSGDDLNRSVQINGPPHTDWKLVRKANSWASPRPEESDALGPDFKLAEIAVCFGLQATHLGHTPGPHIWAPHLGHAPGPRIWALSKCPRALPPHPTVSGG